ncbi:hypothetical protein PG988_001314 [Apiospora saccharicola]
MPVDLLYICVDLGQDVILEEMTKVFELDYAAYNEADIWRIFDIMRSGEVWTELRYASCATILLREDRDGRLLQHSLTFKTLCDIFMGVYHGEGPVLYYLDRGGSYSLNFEDGTWALYVAISSGCVKVAEKLLDLGADPNKLFTRRIPDYWVPGFSWEARNPGFMRLLIRRGFNPFRMVEDNPGMDCLFEECLKQREPGYEEFELFQELCHVINDDTDDGDLFYLLDIAFYHGQYRYIQEIRLHAKDRVDAVIREKAALFLQKLLFNISPGSDHRIVGNNSNIMDMDEIIDTMGLILQLGPRSTLTSSWRLKEGRDDLTALEILQRLLAPPPNPHAPPASIYDGCEYNDRLQYRVFWCLNERVKISSDSGKPVVTILGQRIEWPKEFHGKADSPEYAEEMYGIFARIRPPWGCSHWLEDES